MPPCQEPRWELSHGSPSSMGRVPSKTERESVEKCVWPSSWIGIPVRRRRGSVSRKTSHFEMRSTLTKPPKRPPEEQKEDDADERYYASHCSPRLVVLYEVHRIIET